MTKAGLGGSWALGRRLRAHSSRSEKHSVPLGLNYETGRLIGGWGIPRYPKNKGPGATMLAVPATVGPRVGWALGLGGRLVGWISVWEVGLGLGCEYQEDLILSFA